MKSAKEPTSVDEALDLYWINRSAAGHRPDYLGFYSWVTRRFTEDAHRKHLTDLEYKKRIREWLELRNAKGGQNAQPNDKGHTAAGKKFGQSNKSIRRAVKAGKLTSEAETALKEAGLDDTEKVILEVAEEKPEDQVAKVQEIVRERKQKKTDKKRPPKQAESDDDEEEVSDTSFNLLKEAWKESPELKKAWAEASAGDRKRFIDEILLADEVMADDDSDDWDEAA